MWGFNNKFADLRTEGGEGGQLLDRSRPICGRMNLGEDTWMVGN